MQFERGKDVKEALSIGMEGLILKYVNQSRGKHVEGWSLSTSYQAFQCFKVILDDANYRTEAPITEYLKMLLWILEKYPYHILAKGSRKNGPEQRDINELGASILKLFMIYKDWCDPAWDLFNKTVKTIRLSALSPGQKTQMLKFFRDEYVSNFAE